MLGQEFVYWYEKFVTISMDSLGLRMSEYLQFGLITNGATPKKVEKLASCTSSLYRCIRTRKAIKLNRTNFILKD